MLHTVCTSLLRNPLFTGGVDTLGKDTNGLVANGGTIGCTPAESVWIYKAILTENGYQECTSILSRGVTNNLPKHKDLIM